MLRCAPALPGLGVHMHAPPSVSAPHASAPAEAVNFAMEDWVEAGKAAVPCTCTALPEGVALDMGIFCPELREDSSRLVGPPAACWRGWLLEGLAADVASPCVCVQQQERRAAGGSSQWMPASRTTAHMPKPACPPSTADEEDSEEEESEEESEAEEEEEEQPARRRRAPATPPRKRAAAAARGRKPATSTESESESEAEGSSSDEEEAEAPARKRRRAAGGSVPRAAAASKPAQPAVVRPASSVPDVVKAPTRVSRALKGGSCRRRCLMPGRHVPAACLGHDCVPLTPLPPGLLPRPWYARPVQASDVPRGAAPAQWGKVAEERPLAVVDRDEHTRQVRCRDELQQGRMCACTTCLCVCVCREHSCNWYSSPPLRRSSCSSGSPWRTTATRISPPPTLPPHSVAACSSSFPWCTGWTGPAASLAHCGWATSRRDQTASSGATAGWRVGAAEEPPRLPQGLAGGGGQGERPHPGRAHDSLGPVCPRCCRWCVAVLAF